MLARLRDSRLHWGDGKGGSIKLILVAVEEVREMEVKPWFDVVDKLNEVLPTSEFEVTIEPPSNGLTPRGCRVPRTSFAFWMVGRALGIYPLGFYLGVPGPLSRLFLVALDLD